MDSNTGTGWSFPPHFDHAEGLAGVRMTTGEAEINGSLAVLFTTRLGERLFRPSFGSNLTEYHFQPIDSATAIRIKTVIEDAVSRYERRINVLGIDVSAGDAAEGRIRIVLHYSIRNKGGRSDGTTHSFIYDSI